MVTADVWVATGSACEEPGQAGISHFLEHMMFKGTATRGPGELDRLVEGVGGHWNAGTSKDFTHYYLTVPPDHRSLALDALSDAVLRSTIDPEEVERERSVILEEWRRSEDNPGNVLYTRSYEAAFGSGPYRWPVIGRRETIESITREQLAAYHAGRYRPGRMALVLAGPVGGDAILDEIGGFFTWPQGDDPSDPVAEGTAWTGGRELAIAKDVREVYLSISWPAPAVTDEKEMVAADVAQYLLGEGRASRLYQKIHEEERLVTTIGTHYPAHRPMGIFMVLATCEPAKAVAAREAIVREVTALATEKPAAAELARAKRLLTSHHTFGRETTTGHTSSAGYHHVMTGRPEFDDEYPDLVARVTAASVGKAVAGHFTAEQAVAVAVHPQGTPAPWGNGAEEEAR